MRRAGMGNLGLSRGIVLLSMAMAGGGCLAQPSGNYPLGRYPLGQYPLGQYPLGNYALRQAVVGLDMLSKVAAVCPAMGKDNTRADELERIAQSRLGVSAKSLWDDLAGLDPPLLMTMQQARRVVANAGGCNTPGLAQWQGGARWLTDTSTQVLAGEAPADRLWPRQAALERPLRITVLGQQRTLDRTVLQLVVANNGPAPARMALLESHLFAGLCTRLESPNVPLAKGYLPTLWRDIPPRSSVAALWVLDASCKPEPLVNVGGTAAIDTGAGVTYRRFLLRGVGNAPTPRTPSEPAPAPIEAGG